MDAQQILVDSKYTICSSDFLSYSLSLFANVGPHTPQTSSGQEYLPLAECSTLVIYT